MKRSIGLFLLSIAAMSTAFAVTGWKATCSDGSKYYCCSNKWYSYSCTASNPKTATCGLSELEKKYPATKDQNCQLSN